MAQPNAVPGGDPLPPNMKAVDRLAFKIVQSLHNLFGFSYSRNTEHFVYQKTIDSAVNFTAGTILSSSLPTSQESDFICTRINMNARALANNDASAVGTLYVNSITGVPTAGELIQDVPCLVELTAGSSDRALQNEAVDADLVFGKNGGLPGILAKPRIFPRNTNVQIKLTLLRPAGNAADSLRFRIALIGWKIYDASSLDLTTRRA